MGWFFKPFLQLLVLTALTRSMGAVFSHVNSDHPRAPWLEGALRRLGTLGFTLNCFFYIAQTFILTTSSFWLLCGLGVHLGVHILLLFVV